MFSQPGKDCGSTTELETKYRQLGQRQWLDRDKRDKDSGYTAGQRLLLDNGVGDKV